MPEPKNVRPTMPDRSTLAAEARAAEERAKARPPGVATGRGPTPYMISYDPQPKVMFPTNFAALPHNATADEVLEYAAGWMANLVPDQRHAEQLAALANEISVHRRAVHPRGVIAATTPPENVAAWAQALLDAIVSPGFAALTAQDREALARIHGALVARMHGGKVAVFRDAPAAQRKLRGAA